MSYPNQEETELYYALERKQGELQMALEDTRVEPVLGLDDVARIIKKILKPEEIKVLINNLKEI